MAWLRFSMSDRKRTPELNHLLLLFLLLVAAFLRFYRVSDIPFTQDEFSAIFRTDYSSFNDLIEYGVKPDGHPAGIQVLLFTIIRIFGVSEVALKIPFLLFGLFSLLFAYKIARIWFNPTVGLITVSFLSVLQYMIYYSQVARPYISGTFFSLWMVWHWTKLIVPRESHPGKGTLKNLIGMIIAGILCSYNHHFSLLFAGIVWLTGLFLIEKKKFKYYLLAGFLLVAAYIPHVPVLLHQLKMKGVEGWLAKPNLFFIVEYLAYLFHFSLFLILLVVSIVITGFLVRRKETLKKHPFRIIAILWFFILLVTGFLYSVFINAVLQYSVLIFAFPFLLIFLFSFYPDVKPPVKIILILVIVFTGTSTLILNRHHHSVLYDSGPGKIVEESISQLKKYGEANAAVVLYADRRAIDYSFTAKKEDIPKGIFYIDDTMTFLDLKEYLSTLESDYLIYAWTAPPSIEFKEILKLYFPFHIMEEKYFLSEFHLFSKVKHANQVSNEKWKDRIGFEPDEEIPGFASGNFSDTLSALGDYSYFIDSLTIYGPSYILDLGKLDLAGNDYISVRMSLYLGNPESGPVVVGTIESEGNELIWRGIVARDFLPTSEKWGRVFLSIRLPKEILREKNLIFKTYLWNQDQSTFYVDDLEISVHAGNSRLYGIFEKI